MTRLITQLALLLAISSVAAAQGNPAISGTWALDPAKSDQVPAQSGRAGARGATGAPGMAAPPARLSIAAQADALSITQGTQTVTFKLDGSETFWFQGGENRGTAAWEDGKLVVSWKREFYAGPRQGYVTYSGKDVYTVAGDVLTLEKTVTGPNGTDTKKFVYTKSSA